MKQEQSYKQGLKEIEGLKGDLSAKIIIRPEVSHYKTEFYTAQHSGGGGSTHPYEPYEIKIVDREAVTRPDVEKIELARKRLIEVSENSELFSLRYHAKRALGHEDVSQLINDLEKNLSEEPLEIRQKTLEDVRFLIENNYSKENKQIRNMLRRIYNNNDSKQVRKRAYEMLYRLLVHDRVSWKERSFDNGYGSEGLATGCIGAFGVVMATGIAAHFNVDIPLWVYLGGLFGLPAIGAMIGSIKENNRAYSLLIPGFQDWLKEEND